MADVAIPTPPPVEPAPVTTPIEAERRTAPVELLWDLVFVFAITQVTTLLYNQTTWGGFVRSVLVLALIWWAWSAFVWAANAQAPTSPMLRVSLLLATVLILITGLSVPHAFGSEGVLFACTYAAVRMIHLVLYADASKRGNASWEAIAGFGLTVLIGMGLLIAGAFLGTTGRTLLWTAAIAIDYAGPAWLTRERLRGLQQVAVAHFAERYSTFIIICLGESIVALGLGASHQPLTAPLVAAVALGLLITVELWWTYFDRFAQVAEQRLRVHQDPVLAAADAYSYMHLILVAGIIVFAVGVKYMIIAADVPLSDPARLALCGGVVTYLVGHVAFRLRMVGELGYEKLIVTGSLMLLFAVSDGLRAWILAGVIAVLLGAMCAIESSRR